MREVDKAFLAIFKDLKIVRNEITPGTEDKPNYLCYVGKQAVGYRALVQMLLRYQNALIDILTKEND